jgi:hypothetical protein
MLVGTNYNDLITIYPKGPYSLHCYNKGATIIICSRDAVNTNRKWEPNENEYK